jgi:hypothetical protein
LERSVEVSLIKITESEFDNIRNLNIDALRASHNAEIEVMRLKLEMATKQKAVRDCLYELSKKYPEIDPTAEYNLDRTSVSLVPKGP